MPDNAKVFIPSRPFDINRWSDHPELENCLSEIVNEIENQEGRKRRRTAKEANRFRDCIRLLVLDTYLAFTLSPILQVGVNCGSDYFGPQTRYGQLHIHYRPFIAAFRGLDECGYIKIDLDGYKPNPNLPGHNTKVRATSKLIERLLRKGKIQPWDIGINPHAETVELRAPKEVERNSKGKRKRAKVIPYEESKETSRMRSDLKTIQKVLDNHWIDLVLEDEEYDRMIDRLYRMKPDPNRKRPPFALHHRFLKRIFSNGSFLDGGRFYGVWWQSIPREYRRFITIDGKFTEELDYSGLHPHMLYHLVGADCPVDPYKIAGVSSEHRDLVKEIFNAMLNNNKPLKKLNGFRQKEMGCSIQDFQQKIMDAHQPIKDYFMTGYGLKLQRIDSDIAEKVMLHFAQNNILCLPVHDSFIMHHGYMNDLSEVMEAAYMEIVGGTIGNKKKVDFTEVLKVVNDGAPIIATPIDVDEIIAWTGRNRYEQRQTDWFAR